ncbi:MAG: hypothetical protein EB105_05045, partial [Actinobacteria bacterium]|nr:hypothetical protein [Actinomycetota bacterium]
TGSIGLGPTLAALNVGNTVALANKESLVAGGDLVMAHGRDRIIPVDSEHSALFQAMKSGKLSDVSKVVLTASGGPFRNREDLSDVTVADALAHPTWAMGPVVTINSATLVNKANEVAVAAFLNGQIPFTAIVDTIEKTVTQLAGNSPSVLRDLNDVSAVENDARAVAHQALQK